MKLVKNIVNDNWIDAQKVRQVLWFLDSLKKCAFYTHLNIIAGRLIYWHKVVKLYDFYLNETYQRYCE